MSVAGTSSIFCARQTSDSGSSIDQIRQEFENVASSHQVRPESDDYGLVEWRNRVAQIREKFKDT
jgi:hypothetical protein